MTDPQSPQPAPPDLAPDPPSDLDPDPKPESSNRSESPENGNAEGAAPRRVAASSPGKPPRVARKRGRRRRWVLRLGFVAVVLLAIPLLAAVHYTRPHQLRPLLENLLSQHLGGDVRVGHANLSWGGRLTVESLRLEVPDQPPEREEFARLFETRRLAIQFDFSRLWRGELKVADIEIDRPELHVVEDLDTGQLNLEMLQVAEEEEEDYEPEPFRLTLPPLIQLKGARIQFGQIEDGHFDMLEAIRLEGELRENLNQTSLYDFELRQYDAQARVDAILMGSLDGEAPALNLSLENFSIDTAHRKLMPDGFRELWDRLEPTGQLPNLSIRMDADEEGRLRLDEAVLELNNVAITPPYDELGRPAAAPDAGLPYDPRMTEVSGRFVVRRDSVRIENLTGFIEGIRYYASGTWGFDAQTPGLIAVSTDPFTLDEDPKFLASLPIGGVRIFERLRPSGTFQASTRFERRPGEPTAISGVLMLQGINSRYHKFPFPLQGLWGRIAFERNTLRLDNLVGHGPSGGTVRINGDINGFGHDAKVRIAIEARGVPFDQHVWNAFNEKRQNGIGLFFDSEKYAQLVDEGVIRPTPRDHDPQPDVAGGDPAAPPASLAPTFDLGGLFNVDILVDRDYGLNSKYRVTTAIDAAGMGVLFRNWPYPFVGQSGRIVVSPEGIELNNLAMRGPTGGTGILNGQIHSQGKGKPLLPDLRITEADLPLDAFLLHSLSEVPRQIVADLHPDGRITGTATVTRPNPDENTQWRVYAEVADATLRPNAGGFELTSVSGGLDLGNDGLRLNNLRGQRGDATLAVNGFVDWGDAGNALRLDFTGKDLTVEPALLDLVPPDSAHREKLLALQETHRPTGRVDAQLRWEHPNTVTAQTTPQAVAQAAPETAPETAPEAAETNVESTYTLKVAPDRFALDFRNDRLEFSQMTGSVTLRPDTIDLDRLTAAFDNGVTEVNGLVGLDGVTPTALTLAANAHARCTTTRKFLPDRAVAVLDGLEIDGDYRLSEARLLYRPAPEPGQTDLEVDARVRLVDTNLRVGVPLTGLRGSLDARIRRHPDQPHPLMSFEVRADELRAADRRIAPLNVTLANSPADPGYLRFEPLLGGVYGGVLVGSGCVPLGPDGRYYVDLTISDAEVDPFLKPKSTDPTHPEAPTLLVSQPSNRVEAQSPGWASPQSFSGMQRDLSAGLLSASLSIEAAANNLNDRRGRGALLISDARLVDRPLSNALLRASNLSLPSGAPLSSASARYLIEGNTVRFDELSLNGPNLTIAGAGTMTLPGTHLNLVMVSRNAAAPRLGPVSDIINLFKDELLAVRVTGTLESPKTGVTSLRGFQENWNSIFGETGATFSPGDNVVGESLLHLPVP